MIGRRVMVEFPLDATKRAFFRGQIQKVSTMMRADADQTIHEIHYVVFEDGEEFWMNLKEQEAMGRVVWPPEETTAAEGEDAKPAASAATRRRKRAAPPAGATATRKRLATMYVSHTRRASDNASSSNNDTEQEALPDWLDDMKQWLITVPHGPQNKVSAEETAKKTMVMVRQLVQGHGRTYARWPNGVSFYKGIKVDLDFDFKRMYEEAQAFEEKYGKDKSSCVLRSPIKKLELYQEYRRNQS